MSKLSLPPVSDRQPIRIEDPKLVRSFEALILPRYQALMEQVVDDLQNDVFVDLSDIMLLNQSGLPIVSRLIQVGSQIDATLSIRLAAIEQLIHVDLANATLLITELLNQPDIENVVATIEFLEQNLSNIDLSLIPALAEAVRTLQFEGPEKVQNSARMLLKLSVTPTSSEDFGDEKQNFLNSLDETNIGIDLDSMLRSLKTCNSTDLEGLRKKFTEQIREWISTCEGGIAYRDALTALQIAPTLALEVKQCGVDPEWQCHLDWHIHGYRVVDAVRELYAVGAIKTPPEVCNEILPSYGDLGVEGLIRVLEAAGIVSCTQHADGSSLEAIVGEMAAQTVGVLTGFLVQSNLDESESTEGLRRASLRVLCRESLFCILASDCSWNTIPDVQAAIDLLNFMLATFKSSDRFVPFAELGFGCVLFGDPEKLTSTLSKYGITSSKYFVAC
jgi:hypothetical protein